MRAFAVICTFLVANSVAAQNFCYKDVSDACQPSTTKQSNVLENCNANYGSISRITPFLQAYANTHIARSFEYLLMSTHFANYEKNREGFEKLFRKFSDEKWEDSIELIKYLAKRGAEMNFAAVRSDEVNPPNQSYELYEIQSVAKALDMEKQLATEAFNIHAEATRRRKEDHDPEISSWLEKEFTHEHSENIRTLSGYAADLNSLLRGSDSSLALYLFDEYLQKQ